MAFAHELETVLDLLRDGGSRLAPPVGDLLLRSTDVLSDLVAATRDGTEKPAGFEDELIAALRATASGGASADPGHAAAAAEQAAVSDQPPRTTAFALCPGRACSEAPTNRC